MIAYVPLGWDRARRLRDSGALDGPLPAHAVTSGLLRAHDLAADAEDAEYTALAYAGVAALAGSDDRRLVVAGEVASAPAVNAEDADDDPFGRVQLDRLDWSTVTSLFADDPANAGRIAQARTRAGGRGFAEAVDDQQIESLLDDSDLLWFAPSELDRLLDRDV